LVVKLLLYILLIVCQIRSAHFTFETIAYKRDFNKDNHACPKWYYATASKTKTIRTQKSVPTSMI